MNLENIKKRLDEMLPKGRVSHSLNVANCAVRLSEIYNCDKDKAYLAGIIHDCAKYLELSEVEDYINKYEIYLDELEEDNLALSHSIIGSYIATYEFEIEDEDVINSVKYHTTGRENMSLLEKIIYIADLIEEGRKFPQAETLRKLTYGGELDKALLTSFNNTIKFVIDNEQLIHPRTVSARNYLMKETL
ncbi:HD domain-containing protein [Romboutsia maritimum]|uniref:bis(5'-nucleosyl)-tetraphosphatase (symmetrical) n=1 Tax=Romboutsia maritimum TaxID=2020948 RepID=A0A371IU56_9FIRM|nr:bis(5'-nucleosyl)-tetraphosphatase (symmetrical) YqeK [Romboutsia maritimum]RDY24022.1 HD domain-containing protein [Romboutsia maritimum]